MNLQKRWQDRVVANGWDKMGTEGCKLYLKKYGKNIGIEKLKAFIDFTKNLGLEEWVQCFEKELDSVSEHKIVSIEFAVEHEFNGDIIDTYNCLIDDGNKTAQIIETTIEYLAKENAGTWCGVMGNLCFKEIAKKYPKNKIRTCFFIDADNNRTCCSSCEIWINNKKEGYDIEKLADRGEGILRFDGEGKGWNYFETE